MLNAPPFDRLFLLSEAPVPLTQPDPRLIAILPAQAPCVWAGHFALFTGPFLEVCDDDQHRYYRGQPLEICSKTLAVLGHEAYAGRFTVINRAQNPVGGAEASCAPGGSCC